MKKILTILLVMFAFSLTASAQEYVRPVRESQLDAKTVETLKQAALEDVAALEAVVKFTGQQKESFRKLFEQKHRTYAQQLSDERKANVAKTIEMKIAATLTPENLEKVQKTPGLMKRLTTAK